MRQLPAVILTDRAVDTKLLRSNTAVLPTNGGEKKTHTRAAGRAYRSTFTTVCGLLPLRPNFRFRYQVYKRQVYVRPIKQQAVTQLCKMSNRDKFAYRAGGWIYPSFFYPPADW